MFLALHTAFREKRYVWKVSVDYVEIKIEVGSGGTHGIIRTSISAAVVDVAMNRMGNT